MVMFLDLQLHPDQCQSRQSLVAGSHHQNPQEAPIWTIYLKHKNDSQTKPDLMVVFMDLQLCPDQRQRRQSLVAGGHHQKPQEAPNMDIIKT